jgi:hypothetical protein
MAEIWVAGICSIEDARRVIEEENLSYPIEVACAFNLKKITDGGVVVSTIDFEETVQILINKSLIKEIAFLVSE